MGILYIGQEVRHYEIGQGKENLTIVGLKADKVELKVKSHEKQSTEEGRWFSKKGLITKNMWGAWIYPDDDFFERITRNAGSRD